jgi:hypothetical protein
MLLVPFSAIVRHVCGRGHSRKADCSKTAFQGQNELDKALAFSIWPKDLFGQALQRDPTFYRNAGLLPY